MTLNCHQYDIDNRHGAMISNLQITGVLEIFSSEQIYLFANVRTHQR